MKVIVNGMAHDWERKKISYSDVFKMAFPDEEVVLLSCTYRTTFREGILATCDWIPSEHGMVFSIIGTGSA